MLNVRQDIFPVIEQQFPHLYREDGSLLVEFIAEYYKWLDSRLDRNFPLIGDIDQTYEKYLLLFKEKYLKNFPTAINKSQAKMTITNRNTITTTDPRVDFTKYNFNDNIVVISPSNEKTSAVVVSATTNTLTLSASPLTNQTNEFTTIEKLALVDIRFLVKHISDLYQRKGSEEGLRLLFSIFFGEEIEVFYPSSAILRPSDSRWIELKYLECFPIGYNVDDFPVKRGDVVRGDISGAEAPVDEVIFINFDGAITPIVFLSNIRGAFSSQDSLGIFRDGVFLTAGRIVRGSAIDATVLDANRKPGQVVGEKVKLISSNTGIGAKGTVREVSDTLNGRIVFDLEDGGFGYLKDPQLIQTSTFDATVTGNNTVTIAGTVANLNALIQEGEKIKITVGQETPVIAKVASSSNTELVFVGTPLVNQALPTQIVVQKLINEVVKSNQVYVLPADSTIEANFEDTIEATQPALITAVSETVIPAITPILEFSARDDVISSDNRISFQQMPGQNRGPNSTTPATIVNGHGLQTGVPVIYSSNGGTDLTGLTSGTIYYVIRFDDGFLELATTLQDALAGTEINLTALDANGDDETHTLQCLIGYNIDSENLEFITRLTGSTRVVKQEGNTIFGETDSENAFFVIPDNGKVDLTFTINGSSSVAEVTTISEFNDSASFEVIIGNEEIVPLITDVIGDFVTVQLDSSDYGMSGPSAETIDTVIKDAFSIIDFQIGEITSLFVTSDGLNYQNDVRTRVIQEEIAAFGKREVRVAFETIGFSLEKGDVVTQSVQVPNVETGLLESRTARAVLDRKEGNIFIFKMKSFYEFKPGNINIKGSTYVITSVAFDQNTDLLGENAIITGSANFEKGQIEKIDITNSGFRYDNGETVDVYKLNDDETIANRLAQATLDVTGIGTREGQWRTKTSFISEKTRALRDNFYYQEYSYDINSAISEDEYKELISQTVGVAGTKLFSTPLINTFNDFGSTSDVEIKSFATETAFIEREDVVDLFVTESSPLVGGQPENDDYIVAVIVSLDSEEIIEIR